jgi:hypothetical protein
LNKEAGHPPEVLRFREAAAPGWALGLSPNALAAGSSSSDAAGAAGWVAAAGVFVCAAGAVVAAAGAAAGVAAGATVAATGAAGVVAVVAPGQVLPGHCASGLMGTLVVAVWKLSPELAADATFSTSWESASQTQWSTAQSPTLCAYAKQRTAAEARTSFH